jgi:outer membrane biosynthesis protein TonB
MAARYSALLFRIGSVAALTLVLAGCTKGGQFDPVEIFNDDMFDTKSKLKGDRVPVFPQGVPGTTTGVPADLVKGYQPPPEQADANTAPPAPAVADKPKPKPKPKVALQKPPASTTTRISVGAKPGTPTQQQGTPAQPAWPAAQAAPAQQGLQPSQSVWPAPPPTAPAQQTAQPSQSIWPNPPAPATTAQ